MATVINNLATTGLSGKVGNLVFRRRGNKTTAYVRSPRQAPATENEKQARNHFAEAVALARKALSDEAEYQKFVALAKKEGKESAYSAAVAYYIRQIH